MPHRRERIGQYAAACLTDIRHSAEVAVAITKRYLLFPLARVVRKNGRALKTSLGDKVVRGGTIPFKPKVPDF